MRTRRYLVKCTAEPVHVREEASVELLDAELATSLPGTPRGVGEVQVVIHDREHDRTAYVHEIVHFEPERRAVTRSLVAGYPTGGELQIDPIGQGACRITQAFTADLPAGTQVASIDELRETLRAALATMMRRLAEIHTEGNAGRS